MLIIIAALAVFFSLQLIFRLFVFDVIRVDGDAMMPVFWDGNHVSVNKTAYWFSEPKRGDIIVCQFLDSSEIYIKRVIGIEGDRVRITDGVLYINDVVNYDYFTGNMSKDMGEVTVSEDHVFVMGDNRNESFDSRMVGALPLDMVLGKVTP